MYNISGILFYIFIPKVLSCYFLYLILFKDHTNITVSESLVIMDYKLIILELRIIKMLKKLNGVNSIGIEVKL